MVFPGPWRKIGFWTVVLIIGAAAQLVIRATTIKYRQIHPPPVSDYQPKIKLASEHLSQAIVLENDFVEIRKFLKESYPKAHGVLIRKIINNYSLVYEWPGKNTDLKPILALAHIDVVPAPEKEGEAWIHPPFSGTIDDEFVWGRGAIDDKASVVAWMEVIEALVDEGFRPERTLYMAFGHDEEKGGRQGARLIAEHFRENGINFYFSLDEGLPVTQGFIDGMKLPVAMLGVAEKGYLTVDLKVKSSGGHSSIPHKNTPIERLASALGRVSSMPFPADLNSGFSQMMEFLSPELPFAKRLVLANQWLFSGILINQLSKKPATNALIRTTAVPTIFNAGVAENVLPDKASVTLNLRIRPGETVKSSLNYLRKIVADDGIDIIAHENSNEPPPVTSVKHPAFQAVHRSLKEVFPLYLVAPTLVTGGTDTKHYVDLTEAALRFTPYLMTPEDSHRLHGINERISISDLNGMIRFYRRVLKTTLVSANGRP